MTRKLINDMVEEKRSTRVDIPFGDGRKPSGGIFRSLSVILLGAILVFGAFFFLTSYFSSVEVFITAKRQTADLDNLVSLSKDKDEDGKIRFSLMKIEETEVSNISATGSKGVSNFSKGKVTIFNTISGKEQKLVAGTRLSTTDGKIYKIDKAVTVPAAKGVDPKLIPGQVDVSTTASLPGASYNIPAQGFSIPGFKGTSKYTKIYAKSYGDIAGGFVGSVKVVSSLDLEKVRATLSESIKQKLLRRAILQTPSDYILFDGMYSLTLKDNTIDNTYLSTSSGGSAEYRMSGTIRAVIIDKKSLKNYIVLSQSVESGRYDILLKGEDKLSVTILNKDKINIENAVSLPARIAGSVEMILDLDSASISRQLAGLKKSEYQEVFKGFSSVKKVITNFSPSWAWSFPEDISKIKIIKDFEQDAVK